MSGMATGAVKLPKNARRDRNRGTSVPLFFYGIGAIIACHDDSQVTIHHTEAA